MNVLKTHNLTKIYGAGKTTLMRLITSLTFPDSGEIELFGETSKAGLAAARRRMSATIEVPALYSNLTAVQNLEYYRIQYGIPSKNSVENALKFVNLTDTGNKKFKNFSLGMKQRLGLALAMLSNPDFLILDEPTNGLDPIGIVETRELIKKFSDNGITILISSHILAELSQTATKYGFIHEGRFIKELTHGQLQEECKRALAIKVDDAAKAAAVLETALGITGYKQISANELRVYEHLDNSSEVTFQLAQQGVRVAEMHEVGDSLEDYFKKVIGGC